MRNSPNPNENAYENANSNAAFNTTGLDKEGSQALKGNAAGMQQGTALGGLNYNSVIPALQNSNNRWARMLGNQLQNRPGMISGLRDWAQQPAQANENRWLGVARRKINNTPDSWTDKGVVVGADALNVPPTKDYEPY